MTPDRKPLLSYDTEQSLRALLAAAAETDGLQTPERVETALVAELRRRNRRMLAGRIAAVGTLAAAVLLGLFLTQPTEPDVPPPISSSAPLEMSAPDPPAAQAQPAVVKTAVRRRRAPQPVRPPMAAAEMTEFIPVGPWQAMEPMERGSIIRVRLPKSSLPGFGIPVSADRWNESIPADVVLGEDGSMRAVRFVNTRQ